MFRILIEKRFNKIEYVIVNFNQFNYNTRKWEVTLFETDFDFVLSFFILLREKIYRFAEFYNIWSFCLAGINESKRYKLFKKILIKKYFKDFNLVEQVHDNLFVLCAFKDILKKNYYVELINNKSLFVI